MPRITNTTDKDITLQSGQTLEAGKTRDIPEAVIARAMKEPRDALLFRRGDLSPFKKARPVESLTRETIDEMKRTQVKEYLRAHDLEVTGTDEELRERLKKHIFIDL